MPQPLETPGKPAHNRVQVLLNDDDMAALETQKGDLSASAYVRGLIRQGLANNATRVKAGSLAADGHIHVQGRMLATYTVKQKTTIIYACLTKGCTKEITT